MRVLDASPIRYFLRLGEAEVAMNSFIGGRLSLTFTGRIACVACGRPTRNSFNQGHCYPCFSSLASCDLCILRPELCHFHRGTCREPAWGKSNCMRPHVVYLANSSGVKVGITAASHLSTRWIDQGATEAIPILRVGSRRESGILEAAFKEHVSDRTDWRRMLRGEPPPADLAGQRDDLFDRCRVEIESVCGWFWEGSVCAAPDRAKLRRFRYPVREYPVKIKSLNPKKTPRVEGRLCGIKGQYLILDTGC